MLSLLKYYTMRNLKNEKGQGMVEYALIIGLIAIVVMVALRALAPEISGIFERIGTALKGAGVSSGS